ncbi:hypothetical protein CBOM_07393 [Ceraceosorus bombacis]|uniref:Uncharacterized protein n=1 Tax=Ceraceosorus bombacis TaxID=401625 RepID=A0A0P1BAJ4_9BASI|nr:hypothetical protein CBOM_07393 [Ceraceosorus bombacis]
MMIVTHTSTTIPCCVPHPQIRALLDENDDDDGWSFALPPAASLLIMLPVDAQLNFRPMNEDGSLQMRTRRVIVTQ